TQSRGTISRVLDQGHRYQIKLRSGEVETDVVTSMSFCNNPQCECRDLQLFLKPADRDAGWAEPQQELRAVIDIDSGEILDLTSDCTPALRETLAALLTESLLGY